MVEKLQKEAILDLIDNVVKPVVKKFNLGVKSEYNLVKVAILLLLNNENQFKNFKKFIDFNFSEEVIKEFIKLHSEWIEKNLKTENENSEEENDDFFDFDSEEIDENINNMHYEENQKSSAEEYMKQFNDDDFIIEVKDEIADLKELKEMDLNEYYLNHLNFSQLINLFHMSVEFEDLAYALNTLQEKVQNIDLNSLDETQKQLLKAMLDSIIDDLNKWVETVLINQETRDIHYLDASLLANIAQIDIMLNTQKDDEDDLELF